MKVSQSTIEVVSKHVQNIVTGTEALGRDSTSYLPLRGSGNYNKAFVKSILFSLCKAFYIYMQLTGPQTPDENVWLAGERDPSPWNITWHHFSDLPSPSCPWFSYSPVCAAVISLMTCNVLKALHQPDLLKWSMGNALGHFSSHPHSLNLSHRLASPCLASLSCHPSCCPSVLPKPHFFPSAFLNCPPQLYPDALSLSLHFCPPPPLSPLRGVWTGPLNQQHQRKWTRGIWPLPLSPRSA